MLRNAIKFLIAFCFSASFTWADTLVSIKPLAMIYQNLTQQAAPDVLIPAQQNMHDYALSLGDLRKLQKNNTVIYLGDDSEHALAKIKQKFPHKTWHAVAEKTDHAWLDPHAMAALIENMALIAKQQQPELADQLALQQSVLLAQITQWQQAWQLRFEPFKDQPVLLGHSALIHLLQSFGLQPVLYFSSHSHGQQQSGAKELLKIQQAIQQGQIRCAIEEPEVSFKQLQQRFPSLQREFIDPNGENIALNAQAYLALLQHIAETVYHCVQTKEN